MSKGKRTSRLVGDLVAIPLGSLGFAFAWVLEEPSIAVFDLLSSSASVNVEELLKRPVLFRIWVMNHAITKGTWSVVGHADPDVEQLQSPWFYKQDSISGAITLTKDGAQEVSTIKEEAQRHECAAVWEPEHVADRVRDHYLGVPNKWKESLAIR